MAPPRSHEGAYIPLDALQLTALDNVDDKDNEALEQHILVLLLGGLLILLAVTLLAVFWHQFIQAAAINTATEPEPARYWMRIVQAGWAARLVTVCTTVMLTVVALQGGLGTAMVAAILLETTTTGRGGVSLFLGPFYSLLRASKASPVTLWTATGFRPRFWRGRGTEPSPLPTQAMMWSTASRADRLYGIRNDRISAGLCFTSGTRSANITASS
ncbi:hypothetical protein MY4038_006579 [Beauveria bassiana]